MSATLTNAAGPLTGSSLYDYTSGFKLQDDFLTGGTGTGGVGVLGWGSGGGVTATYPVSETNHPGIVQRSTGSSSGTFAYLYLPATQGSLLAGSVEMVFVARLNTNDANTRVRVGAMYLVNTTPTDGEYFEKLDADTNWFAVTRASSVETGSRTDTGVAVGTGWVTFRIVRTADTSVQFYLNGALVATQTANIPTSQGLTPGLQIRNNEAAIKTIDLDYFEITRTGLTR